MPRFLTETYVPSGAAPDLAEAIRRLEAATRDAGTSVQYVRSIAVPDDETCFHLFEAPSAEAVEEFGRLADLGFDRVTQALEPAVDQHE